VDTGGQFEWYHNCLKLMMDPNKTYNILRKVFGEDYTTRKKQFLINCFMPECGDTSGNLEVSLDKRVFHCWKCNYSGNIRKLLKDYLGYVPEELDEDFYSFEDLVPMQPDYDPNIQKDIKYIQLPKEFCPLWIEKKLSFIGQKALAYATSRLSIDEIQNYKIGYCGLGDYRWRLIVPSFESGKVVYFIGRDFMGQKLRYKNPAKEEFGTGADDIVFNIDGARIAKQAIISEGVFDAMRIGNDGVALFGSDISNRQLLKLLDIPKIYVLLDRDAIKKAIVIADFFIGYRRSVSLVIMPPMTINPTTKKKMKDPADWPREEIRKWIFLAEPYTSWQKFLALKE